MLQPGEGGPKPRTASGVDRTDVAAPAPKRERKFWDVALSIVLIILSIGAYLTGAVIGLLGIALFGNCPTGTCGGETVTTTGLVLLAVTILGSAATIGLLVLRFRAWWLAAVCWARSSSPGSSATRSQRLRRLSLTVQRPPPKLDRPIIEGTNRDQ